MKSCIRIFKKVMNNSKKKNALKRIIAKKSLLIPDENSSKTKIK